jgi:hypothetical protein
MAGNKFISFSHMLLIGCCLGFSVAAQKTTIPADKTDSTPEKLRSYYKNQMDLIDIALIIIGKDPGKRLDSNETKNLRLHLSASPILEYTLSTGFTTGVAGSGAFYTSVKKQTNTSSVLVGIKYTQKKQFLLPIQSFIWTPGNKYNLFGDWRYLNYPQDSYGIGGTTTLSDKFMVTYKYLRFYEFAFKDIGKHFYIGLGHQLDYHWAITELDVPAGQTTDFNKYGFNKTSASSGVSLNLLYDSRKNSLNPEGGSFYMNLEFLQNSTAFGSNSDWNSILIDLRKYVQLPHKTILAFWFYSVLTLSGNPPYLDLPGAGTDTYNNTGRGYELDRFIGKKLVDLEAEFRFGVTKNGLIGAVLFCNAASVSELSNNKFEVIYPGVGLGLRIKFNKFSNTNACLDYGIGTKGSRGFFGNLGEVF